MFTSEVEAVQQALAAGRITVPNPETGFHRALFAICPNDGGRAQVRRVVRDARGAITQVTVRCPQCHNEFAPGLESLRLR